MRIVIDKNSDFRHKGGSTKSISPGALRAALSIQRSTIQFDASLLPDFRKYAEIIDESTGLPELLEALKNLLETSVEMATKHATTAHLMARKKAVALLKTH